MTRDETAPTATDRVEDLLADLTIGEKLDLIHGAPDPEGVATGYVPSIDRPGVPSLRLVDGPLGVRPESGSATAFPASISLAASWNPSLAGQVGTAIAREARAYDQDVLLAPGVNIARVPHGGRNFEYYGEDPQLASRLAAEYVEGVQSAGVMATVKHFVANNQETDRYDVSATVSERALREIYLPAFRAAVESDVAAVMTAYNRVNGIHMSDHHRLLTEVLKGEWGFQGFVMSDWWGTESTVEAARAGLDLEMPGVPFEETAAAEAVPEGIDPATIPFPDTLPAMHEGGLFGDPLSEALDAGDVDEATIDEKVRRLCRTMDRFGLLDRQGDSRTGRTERSNRSDRSGRSPGDGSDGELDTSAHRDLAHRAACEGAVLLKNDDGTLPLGEEETIALCGPNADRAKLGGGGSSEVTPFAQVSPAEGLRERAGDLTFERGMVPITGSSLFDAFAPDEGDDERDGRGESSSDGPESGSDHETALENAITAAEAADCAVVVVQDDTTESEDRSELRLSGAQDDLVSRVAGAAERTIVVCRTSGPIEMSWLDDVDALLQTWYPGQADGEALAAMLYGDTDPGGRLPVTFGRRASDYPTASEEAFPGVDGEARYDEGVFVGYRYFDYEGTEPLFPFGHGLSYTDFEHGDPVVEPTGHGDTEVEVTVPVRNVGDRPGSEVVQVYVGEDDPALSRPERELKGFAKVHLEPGERQEASVTLDREAFSYYDPNDGWTVSPGTFTIAVGRSSRDIRGETSIETERE